MGTMDSMDTWPAPVTVDDRGFDLQAMRQLRRPPGAQPPAGVTGATPVPDDAAPGGGASSPSSVPGEGEAGDAAPGTTAAAPEGSPAVSADLPPASAGPATPRAAGVLRTREKLANSMILVIPVVSALAVVLCWIRYTNTHNGWWLGALAVILVLAALAWVSTVKRAFAGARGQLAARLPGVIGYGVGIVREADVSSPFDETGVSDTVTARLTLSVNPVHGAGFRAVVDAVYNTADAEKLKPGVHGPVRYLRSDPEHTVGIETRLDDEKVRQIYRAAAMN